MHLPSNPLYAQRIKDKLYVSTKTKDHSPPDKCFSQKRISQHYNIGTLYLFSNESYKWGISHLRRKQSLLESIKTLTIHPQSFSIAIAN